jgi:TonB-linked SusC/RagA family outer membrane protein
MMKQSSKKSQQALRIFGSFVLATLLIFNTYAQRNSYSIKGKVSDANGGVPGASVKIDGTSYGTTTDVEGNYNLNASLSAGKYSITANSIGYTTSKKSLNVGNESTQTLDFTLQDDVMNLDEVVVTGSTIKTSRRELGNSISSVSAEQLQKTGSNNLLGALQGKVPGAQITQNSGDPAGGITIRLRGVKSIQGASDPLYVIDGVILNNNSTNVAQTALSNQVGSAVIGTNRLADINPNDIESINIINGAAAAAQYGSRAANGVVLITTKRGKSGTPKVTFSTSVSSSELRKKVFISTLGKQYGWAALRLHTIGAVTPAQITANPGTTVTGIVRDGTTTNLASNLVDVTRYDYQDQIFRNAIGTDNALSISGGTDKTQYYASLSYAKNEGIVKNVDFQRYGLRARIDQRLLSWAKLSVGLSYVNSLSNEKANGNVFYSPINSINITNNIYDITKRDADGNLLAVEPTRVNPLTTIEDMKFSNTINRTTNDIQLNLTPLKGLSIDWVLGIDTYSALGRGLIPVYPYQAVAGLPAERYPSGYSSNVNNVVSQYNSDINIGYEKNLTEDLKVNLTAGYNYQFNRNDFSRANGELLAPGIETVSGAATAVTTGYGIDRYNLSGTFGQATIGFKNLAFITGAIRRDRSSKFSPSETNQTYPKFSASFVPSDLGFWKDAKFNEVFSGMKVRYSWGQAGNLAGIGSFDRFYQFNPAPYLGRITLIPSATFANPNVKPERMTESEGGVDLSFMKDKINLTFTAYSQVIKDLVVNRVLASSTGGNSIVNNVGEMTNKGVEIGLNISPIKTKDFSWDLGILYNRNRNVITKLGSPTVSISNSAGAPIFLIEGQPASVFYGFPYAKNPDGTYLMTAQNLPQRERGTQTNITDFAVLRDDKGQPSFAAGSTFVRTIIGNANPDWTGSLINTLNYKKASLRFMLDAVQGNEVFNADKRTRNNVGIGDIAQKEMTGELPRGYVFSLVNIEEYRVDDGSFVKLREISLNYQLPNLIKGMSNLNVSLIGRNLFSWDKYNGFDPETNAGGNSDLLRGVDFGNVPIPRSYQLQLTASF